MARKGAYLKPEIAHGAIPFPSMELGLIAFLVALGALVGFAVIQKGPAAIEPAPPKPELPPGEVKPADPADAAPTAPTTPATAPASNAERYRAGLGATRQGFIARLDRLLRGAPKVDASLHDEIEALLFTADIGAGTAQKMLDTVTESLRRDELTDADKVWARLREEAREIVQVPAPPLDFAVDPRPYVLLAVGVNGVGKTTTLAKLAARHKEAGRKVLLVAGDTFRAAACEQLQSWGDRLDVPVHAGAEKADPAGVIFDGIRRGKNEGFDVVLCDTAGRLHTRKELMAELEKIHRSAAKALSTEGQTQQAHDTFLVLDATIGQNAVNQAHLFKEATQCTGIVVTKLDGTAKGGVVLGICDQLQIPIRYLGVGEQVDDLRDFDPDLFVDTLFTVPTNQVSV